MLSAKQAFLQQLAAAQGESLSGQELANNLGVRHGAVSVRSVPILLQPPRPCAEA